MTNWYSWNFLVPKCSFLQYSVWKFSVPEFCFTENTWIRLRSLLRKVFPDNHKKKDSHIITHELSLFYSTALL